MAALNFTCLVLHLTQVFFLKVIGEPKRVWYYPALATVPVMPDSTDGDDNSPISLPDGRFASLQMPNSTHDLKLRTPMVQENFF